MGLTAYAWQKLCNFGIMFYDRIAGHYDPTQRPAKQKPSAPLLNGSNPFGGLAALDPPYGET